MLRLVFAVNVEPLLDCINDIVHEFLVLEEFCALDLDLGSSLRADSDLSNDLEVVNIDIGALLDRVIQRVHWCVRSDT